MYFATVETATSMPTIASSLPMRGTPQVTFACDILRIARRQLHLPGAVPPHRTLPPLIGGSRLREAPRWGGVIVVEHRISLTTSRSSPGRPTRLGRLLRFQNRLNPSRCQRITVAGSTTARASLQPAHPCERIVQKARSHAPRRRRPPP